ncbi:MAG TPA: hypothetical protein VHB46_10615 [Burkholderiales bacterium]|nr:hypothetical protein [Burkholderiales bacterium]
MRRFSIPQLFVLAIGFGLILSGLFFNQILRSWENYRYPNAVYWQGLRLVPDHGQKISAPDKDMVVVKIAKGPAARLTLYLRPDDGLTPMKMVRALCARDPCSRTTANSGNGDRAAANYRIGGEAMQILLIRPTGANVWIEFNGPPDALPHFDNLIDSVTTQLALRNASEQAVTSKN